MAENKIIRAIECNSPQCECGFQKAVPEWQDAIDPINPSDILPINRPNQFASIARQINNLEGEYNVQKQKPWGASWSTQNIRKRSQQKIINDPQEQIKFKPSIKLTILINMHTEMPSPKEADAYNEIRMFYGKAPINRFAIANLDEIISEEIEDFLIDWANRIDTVQAPKFISKDGEFTREVSFILLDRFQVNFEAASPFLKLLYSDLFKYVIKGPWQRAWGQLSVVNSEIILEVKEGIFKLPKFESFFE